MTQKRIIIGICTFAIMGAAAIAFQGCKKEGELNTQELKPKGWVQANGVVINGQYIEMSSSMEVYEYLQRQGSGKFYLWVDGKRKVFVYGDSDDDNPPPPPPPPPVPPLGKFVQNTLKDIMNAPIAHRRILVIENMEVPYHPCVSLSAKIGEALVAKVASGEYIISHITEECVWNADETEVRFIYNITFSNADVEGEIVERTVLFTFNKIMDNPDEPDNPDDPTIPPIRPPVVIPITGE